MKCYFAKMNDEPQNYQGLSLTKNTNIKTEWKSTKIIFKEDSPTNLGFYGWGRSKWRNLNNLFFILVGNIKPDKTGWMLKIHLDPRMINKINYQVILKDHHMLFFNESIRGYLLKV